jgi:hypothetical protein
MDKKTEKIKINNSDFKNLPLTEYYAKLPNATRVIAAKPKDELLEAISELTGRTPETVRTWCLGQNTPPFHVQEKIAKHLNSSPEILFPDAV